MFRRLAEVAPQWAVSILLHLLVVVALTFLTIDHSARRTVLATVVSELGESLREEDFQESLIRDEQIRLDAPVTLTRVNAATSFAGVGGGFGGGSGGGQGSGTGSGTGALANPATTGTMVAAAAALGNRSLNRPLAASTGGLSLDSNISGLKGINELVSGGGGSGGTAGDFGAIDRISQEILRQLNKNRVIVAWIFDASLSLSDRRANIAKRFDRIYKELDELGVHQNDALLTAVVSAGASTEFLTNQPTSDVSAIRKAIHGIEEDKSGKENLFTAVRETALKYRRIQTAGRRTLMIVLVTDEIGDDTSRADETVELLKRNRVPVYVMGPMASFSRPVLHDHWRDPKTGYDFWTPVTRGPYTRREEILRVPFIGSAYLSGFGPFALSQLTRETGGVFFVYDDDRIGQGKFDMDVLLRYKANYGSEKDYETEIHGSKFRRTIMEVVEAGNAFWSTDYPGSLMRADDIQNEIERRDREAAKFLDFARKAIPALEAVKPEYDAEPHPRWRANFDLTFARLLLAKIRCDDYQWALREFKASNPRIKDRKKHNCWARTLVEGIRIGSKSSAAKASAKVSKEEERAAETSKRLLEQSLFHFDRLLKEHPGTPWANAAQAERSTRVATQFVESYFRNYSALTPEEQKAFNEAAKRVPKR